MEIEDKIERNKRKVRSFPSSCNRRSKRQRVSEEQHVLKATRTKAILEEDTAKKQWETVDRDLNVAYAKKLKHSAEHHRWSQASDDALRATVSLQSTGTLKRLHYHLPASTEEPSSQELEAH